MMTLLARLVTLSPSFALTCSSYADADDSMDHQGFLLDGDVWMNPYTSQRVSTKYLILPGYMLFSHLFSWKKRRK
jgi:hypothetical protein